VGQPPRPATGRRGKVAGHDRTKTTGRQDRRHCNRTARLVIRLTSGHHTGLIMAGAVPSLVQMSKVTGHDHTKTTGRQDRRRCNRTARLVIRLTSGHRVGLIMAGAVPSPVPMLKSNEQLPRAILPPTHQRPSVETRRLSTQAMGKMWNGMCGETVIGHDITSCDGSYSAYW